MAVVVLVLLSILLPLLHLTVTKGPWTRRNILRMLLVYAFIFDVGAVGFFFGLIPHVFFADAAAKLIGWPPGNPFQFEVGVHDGAWGILGFLCVFIGGGFWLATALGWSFFLLGAAYGHVHQLAIEGNFAPYNLIPAFTDTFIPLWLLGLLYLYYHSGGLEGSLRREREAVEPWHPSSR